MMEVMRWKCEEVKVIRELLENYRFGDKLFENRPNEPHD
jgi:hypothetical protein